MNIGVCVPICDPLCLPRLRTAFSNQSLEFNEVLLLDSTMAAIPSEEWPHGRICRIDPAAFDHAGSRQLAARALPRAEVVVFLTQDAIPVDQDSLRHLVAAFSDPSVGAVFGRQLPRPGAGEMEAHARLFNYPAKSRVTSLADVPRLGLKAAFISNSFAAYRRTALGAVGGFPEHNIVSEDTLVAARMLRSGWRIVYCAEARVYHSHAYSLGNEFSRYFDIGVFHARESWIRRQFGEAEKEGARFVISELKFLLAHKPGAIPSALLRLPVRYLGFRAGLGERFIPCLLKRRLSMQKNFWTGENCVARSCFSE